VSLIIVYENGQGHGRGQNTTTYKELISTINKGLETPAFPNISQKTTFML
jgi:hypothetical protein